jgi:cyclohexanone monooxygenase
MGGQRVAVRVDPATGLKVFDTKAAPEGNITGSGYGVLTDESLKVLPEQPVGAVFDAVEQAKYRAYKEARRGAADYIPMEGEFARYLRDVYSADPVPREALTDECDILVVGAGFAGLLLWHKLTEAGFVDVRFCEKGGDVGGTWYWNRYPGIACDVEAYSYLPLLEEMGYVPSMKFASGFEIYEYCQAMAERFGFYERCLFHTTVERTEWDETTGRWTVLTDRGDAMRARFVILANGILTTPKLARIRGMESFEGDSFHTSRWDYDVDLHGKRVGIIGTGATAVQAIPELANVAGELFVFQRTPSTIDVRDQRETTDAEREVWANEPGWARARRARFAKISQGRAAIQANDDYLAGRVPDYKERKQHERTLTPEELVEKQLDSNFRIMEQIRARVDAIVEDPRTAEALKPYYPYGCKRPTFHDEYLPTFNLPHVHLVDTAPMGVAEINERGVVHDGVEYPLDVLIYATGFQWMATSTFNMVVGREGRSLSDKWQTEGTKTFLGLHTHGFPNLFIITGPQGGGGSFNFTDAIDTHSDYVTWMLSTMREAGDKVVDVRKEDEEAWAAHCREADLTTAPLRDCLSYYNGHGEAQPGSLAYYGGSGWKRRCRDAQETLLPYVFQRRPESDQS